MTHSTADPSHPVPAALADWLAALEARHLADLRVPEVTRALRALSSAYVERRHRVARGAALDTAGKRAAFALFYGPLHFLLLDRLVRALGADAAPPASLLDLGCGSGAAGAAWALAAGGTTWLSGIDRHPWAVQEARWTWRQLRLRGQVRHGDVGRLPSLRRYDALLAAYVLNELADAPRRAVEDQLLAAAAQGARVLIVEPIARTVTPWWSDTGARVVAAGGRADEWRLPVELPPLLRLFDRAAGLDHRVLTARTLFLPGRRR